MSLLLLSCLLFQYHPVLTVVVVVVVVVVFTAAVALACKVVLFLVI